MRSLIISKSITDRKDESINLYLKEISKIPLIDPSKEIELALKIQNGDMQALHELVSANLRFVVSVAKQYQYKGLPLVDLIQAGSIGIMEAALKYNPHKGIKFISYAVWWIRQSILLALSNDSRTVRVPTNQVHFNSKINKVIEKYEQLYERRPSEEEIEKETDININKINLAISSIKNSISLETPFKEDEVGTIGDLIQDDNAESPNKNIESEYTCNEIEEILSEFSNREGDIVRMSFGIGMDNMTYEEIGVRFGIGEERVRQILHSTLDKMKRLYGDRLRELL